MQTEMLYVLLIKKGLLFHQFLLILAPTATYFMACKRAEGDIEGKLGY